MDNDFLTERDLAKLAKEFPNGNDLAEAAEEGFRDGCRHALTFFAWWKNGHQWIGRQNSITGEGDYRLDDAIHRVLTDFDERFKK